MTLTQIGLCMDIVGFLLIIPTIGMKEKGFQFEPVIGDLRWWLRVSGIGLVALGFALQLAGTYYPAPQW